MRWKPQDDVGFSPDGGRHLREDDLASRWRISRRTIQRWRAEGRAPAHLQIGGRILYRFEDIQDFEALHLRQRGEEL